MAHEEAPTITVTFLPAKSESSPDSRAPTRAPMENTDTTAPCKITILNDQFLILSDTADSVGLLYIPSVHSFQHHQLRHTEHCLSGCLRPSD